MQDIAEQFERIKTSMDPELIDDFLIELGKNPQIEYVPFIDYFLEKSSPEIVQQIKLNLIYDLGELGRLGIINQKYFEFLKETFFNSDRWVRNEIIVALNKILSQSKTQENIFELLGYAIIDEYIPLKISGLKTLLLFDKIPIYFYNKIFLNLHTTDSNVFSLLTSILQKFIMDEEFLFKILEESDNYKIFKRFVIRSLLISFFNSVLSLKSLENFRVLVMNSEWINKENFIHEIDIYEKILLKTL